jgi:hypothetical protein
MKIEVLEIHENADKSATITVDVDQEMINMFFNIGFEKVMKDAAEKVLVEHDDQQNTDG